MKKQPLLYLGLSICLAFASCKPHDKFHWNAGWSAPKYYGAAPSVEYLYKGQSLAEASSSIGADPGWGETSGGYTGGDKYKDVPDSVHITWTCGFDMINYEGGFRLPREKMLRLFKQKAIDTYGEQKDYGVIVAGLAPGGNVTIWMQGGTASTEIAKFKAHKISQTDRFDKNSVSLWTSTGDEAKEILRYIKIHGVPYSVWEKGEKEYNYDIGFSTTKRLSSLYDIAITGTTKDGSYVYSDSENLLKFDEPHKISAKKLPVQFSIRWVSKTKEDWYEGFVVLPQDLPKTVITFEKNYGRNPKIVVAIEDNTKDKAINYGKIFIQNVHKRVQIMKFRLAKFNFESNAFNLSKYSLPKGFVFPKWEGRGKLTFPDLDYWQEK